MLGMGRVDLASAETLDVPGAYPSIQAALDAAPAGAVVQIAPGTYTERLELRRRGAALTLRGDPADPSRVVIDAGGHGAALSLFDVGDDVAIEGLTFTGGAGRDGHGGGLYMVRSAATFRRCVFRGNVVSADGGGAWVLASAGLFQDCEFRDNVATQGAGLLVLEGSTTVFERCRFLDNRATPSDGPGVGGGFYVANASVTFLDCLVQGNHANGAGAGGVILAPTWDQPERSIFLRGCRIVDNTIDDNPTHLRHGGGLHVEDNVRVRIVDGVIRGNVAADGGGIANYRAALELEQTIVEDNRGVDSVAGEPSFGGGLFVESVNPAPPDQRPATLRLVDSVVRRNSATLGGGIYVQGDFIGGGGRATMVAEGSTIADNVAGVEGGGVWADRALVTVRRTHLLRNRADRGGGIASYVSTLDVADTTLAGNVANRIGGAIFCDRGGVLQVDGARITGNQAGSTPANAGGAIGIGETTASVSGRVRGSIIGDNGTNYELFESDCRHEHPSQVTFVGNALHSTAGGIYTRYCGDSADSVAALNAMASKASGNVDAAPTFVSFQAVPSTIAAGGTSMLSWVAPAGSGLDLAPGVGGVDAPIDDADVTPSATTTYQLGGPATVPQTATVQVRCAALGMAVARTPSDGGRVAPGDARLQWHPARGAERYDVYVDRDAQPTTLVAADVDEAAVVVPDLVAGASYRWRVVAKNAACDAPVESLVHRFETCTTDPCVTYDFESGTLDAWPAIGTGGIRLIDGMLEVQGAPRVRTRVPMPDLGDAVVVLTVVPWQGRQFNLYFGYFDNGTTLDLMAKGRGKWALIERRNFQKRVLARGQHAIASRQPLEVRFDVQGAQVTVSVDGVELLRGTARGPITGGLGVGTRRGRVRIDDIRIARAEP